MSCCADKPVIDTHTDTHTHTDAGNDNTRRPKLASGKKTGNHYGDVIMGTITSEITSLAIVYSTVYSDAGQRKHQSSALLVFVRGIHRGPVNSPHKWPVTRKMFSFDDVIMVAQLTVHLQDIFNTRYHFRLERSPGLHRYDSYCITEHLTKQLIHIENENSE